MHHGGRTVILSDTHLGRPVRGGQSPNALRPLWRGASHLILNGDTAELADVKYRVAAAGHVIAIQQMCEEDGVELTLLPGNHDPMIAERRYLELCGGEVFVTHGDALHPAISPWTAHRHDLRRFHAYTLASLEGEAAERLEARLDAAGYASHFTWDDWYWHEHESHGGRLRKRLAHAAKIARVLWYWQTLPHRAARFARAFAPEARFFVFGHIHRAGVWKRGRQVLINTGSYDFPVNPRAVVIEGGELRVHRVESRGETFELAERAVARFAIAADRRAAAA